MTDSIKIYLLLLIGFLLITCPIIIINYVHDPYAIFTKVVDKNTLISKNYRYSFPNIAKKMFFKTAIIGTSDSLPYHQKNTKKLLNGPLFNFAIEGATNYEQSLLVENILDNKPKTLIIWQINWLSFLWKRDHSRIGKEFPLYLYKKDNFNLYLKSLLNPFHAFKSVFYKKKDFMIAVSDIKSWNEESENKNFTKEFNNRKSVFFDFIHNNQNIRDFDKKELNKQFDLYIEDLVKNFPMSKFIIVLPPFHDMFLNAIKIEKPRLYNQFVHFNIRVIRLAKEFKNVELVNFYKKCNFAKRDEIYKDLFHFKNKFAKFFIQEIVKIKLILFSIIE